MPPGRKRQRTAPVTAPILSASPTELPTILPAHEDLAASTREKSLPRRSLPATRRCEDCYTPSITWESFLGGEAKSVYTHNTGLIKLGAFCRLKYDHRAIGWAI